LPGWAADQSRRVAAGVLAEYLGGDAE